MKFLSVVPIVFSSFLTFPAVLLVAQSPASGAPKAPLYNTVKQKLLEGKQVFSFTQSKMDIADYCERAKHYDFTWFEMQHSTLEFADVEKMIAACPHVKATPMVRLPDAQEWHIQHATDIGALGVVVPTVDDVDRAREAAKWSRYPPVARRSTGMGQAPSIWGVNGVNYLSWVSGFAQTDERYHQLVDKVRADTLRAGKIFGQANATYATGPYSKDAFFFQNGPSNDGWQPPKSSGSQSAPPPGER
jgi:hypothetical protein